MPCTYEDRHGQVDWATREQIAGFHRTCSLWHKNENIDGVGQ